ncbi:cell division protein FtsI/penicillin-binding protein 2 [Saccharomonospora amisosensis]|uniref:Cell division protein FtsI/penicillin-binding protein 2 n=1 Tax=Saccharomonospora amisosensis TaxID=1128677 RepID=A0A7X5UTR7_9PSEU|nr:penicillin-binding transpeptidase domain-containing protein [Saccharomonospora amisosensis]NIJ13559.1 cell division protein FtsI/penicillin-binding protein 2 [Saccharomonospora amisosensis]
MRTRPHPIVSLLLGAALILSGCGVFGGSDAEDVTTEFLAALAGGDTERAAALTDSPGAAKSTLDQVRSALQPEAVEARVNRVDEWDGREAGADYRIGWRLGDGRRWDYDARARLYQIEGEWKLRWQPTVVHPKLGANQSLALRTELPPPAPVLDRDGAPLLTADTVVSVLVDRKEAGEELQRVVGTLADKLGPLDASITRRSIGEGVRNTEAGKPYVVAVLRSTDYYAIKPAIYNLPGVRFTSQQRLLPVEKDLGSQVLPAIRTAMAGRLGGKPGWRIVVVDASGAELDRLHSVRPQEAKALNSTLSLPTQQAAERALDEVDVPGAIVALRPSTGELLAVAQNEPADAEGAIALTGRYPPGSTFKIATAAAVLGQGRVRSDTRVECPPTTVIADRLVPNDERFGLPTGPLHTAFAHSCNTTFARLSADLPPSALTEAARSLGIGADFVVPGITTVTGSAPPGDTRVLRAENGFGQGRMLASPFGMALMAGTVAPGKTPVPSLVSGQRTEATKLGEPLKPEVLKALRGMMREVVTDGTARQLSDLPGVHGKTGTAQFGDGSNAHGWFAGYSGDVAFSVLLVGAGSSKPAVQVSERFLEQLS